jgi:probable HAF family extracellular repeat protein
MKRIVLVVPFVLLLGILVCAQDYRVTNVGSLGGSAVGYGLSSAGQVLGKSEISAGGDQHTFTWNRSIGIFDVDAFIGQHLNPCDGNPCEGTNSHQAIVGYYGAPAAFHAFLWMPPRNQVQDLGTLGGSTSIAIGINDAGEVVGGADIPAGPKHAFLWSPVSGMQDIDGSPDYASYAVAINNLRQVAGVRDHGHGVTVVFLWTPDGGLEELGFQGRPYAINENGEMVGRLDPIGHAFYWSRTTGLIDLATLPGHVYSEAVAINNHNQVVGTSTSVTESVPFIWTPPSGMKALAPLKGRWTSAAINDAGQVLVNHYFGRGRTEAKLLTPFMHVELVSSSNPSKVGEAVTFTATVNSVQGPANGLLIFKVDKQRHEASLTGGQASFTTSNLSQGTHSIAAHYPAGPIYYGSTSSVVQQVVNP